ncbi:MAG: orotidine-5'-phosphate decarboxylase [Candidatus Korobacteraceae bacterium]|jgi:orotidine-5'-phosphate decarboxylase
MTTSLSKTAPINARSRLMVALDVPTARDARRIVDQLDARVDFFKVGLELFTGTGLEFVRELQSRNKQIFLDLKVFDVGETVKRTVKVVVDAGVSFLTIHGNTEIVTAAAEARGNSSLKLLSVTVLTSLDVKDIRDLGYECSLQELALHRAMKALEAGCDGVISSPREAKLIKDATHGNLLVVTPGIRPLGAQLQDHKRAGDPRSAIENGADYLVVGRPITAVPDPAAAADAILAEMQLGFNSRVQN